MTAFRASFLPVLVIVAAIIALWYAALIPMNKVVADPFIAQTDGSFSEQLRVSGSLERPVLPSPHQVIAELNKSVLGTPLTREVEGALQLNNRNLLFHVWTTLSSHSARLRVRRAAGCAVAIGIVHVTALRLSLMPWIIASQPSRSWRLRQSSSSVLALWGLSGWCPNRSSPPICPSSPSRSEW